MATIKFEAIAKVGTYKDGNGAEKTRFHKCGVVFESAKGLSLKLDSIPVGFDGWLSLREPRPKDSPRTAPQTTAPAASADPNDDIPF